MSRKKNQEPAADQVADVEQQTSTTDVAAATDQAGQADTAVATTETQQEGGTETGSTNIASSGEMVGQLAGVQLQGGEVVELKDMPEEELRKLGTDMQIAGADTLPVKELALLIQAEKVLIPTGTEESEQSSSVSDQPQLDDQEQDDEEVPTYIVNRERLEHDGEEFTFGDLIQIDDAKAAQVLLGLGAILEDE